MKRVLIYENEYEIQCDIDGLRIVGLPAIEKVIKEFEHLNLGELTSELLADAIFNNSDKISKLFKEAAEKEAENIKHPVMRQNLFNGINEALIEFRQSVNNYVGLCDRRLLRLISIEEGKPVVTDENIEKIKESHRVYVTPDEARLFELHKKIAADLTSFFAGIADSTLHSTIYMSRFFVAEEGKFIPKPCTDYASLLKHEPAQTE